MKLFSARFLFIVFASLFLIACSPHPGTGVWKASGDNAQGIAKITVGFEGKAEFISRKLDNALWHCFWTTSGDKEITLKCMASTNTEQSKAFTLVVNDQGMAELRDETSLLGTFSRSDENPSPRK